MKEGLSSKKQTYWTLFLLLGGMQLILTAYFNSSFKASLLPQQNIASQYLEQFKSILPKRSYQTHHPLLSPFWKCYDPSAVQQGRPEKVIFVHVFKTAGMSIRELLLRYAVSCHAGIGLVAQCSGVSADSLQQHSSSASRMGQWINGFGSNHRKPCRVKAIDRNQTDISLPKLRMEPRQLSHLDLLAGHLSLVGNDSGFSASSQSIQYIIFFRSAIAKFVSGIMYQKKDQHYSFHDIVTLIRKRVRGELKQKKYREGYSAYLLSPQQKQMLYGSSNHTKNNVEIRIQRIIDNLHLENIVFGIVERMSESLEIIQYVLDSEEEQTPLFESFGMVRAQSATQADWLPPTRKVNNPSKFSTNSIIAELKKDPEFFAQLQEYVKYDEQIYLQALDLHTQQYQWLQEERLRSVQIGGRT